MMSWHWPGNIRELQNVIERCVILAEDTVLRLERARSGREFNPPRAREPGQRAEIEAIRARRTPRRGPHGAAAPPWVP